MNENNQQCWKKFEASGDIEDYIQYKHSEDVQSCMAPVHSEETAGADYNDGARAAGHENRGK